MALKQYKPTSPSRRGLILVDKSALWKGKPVKALTEGKIDMAAGSVDGNASVGHREVGRSTSVRR